MTAEMSLDPKVAIVIVNWNKKNFIIDLLSSLRDIDYKNCDIIVVDNASTDDSVTVLKIKFPGIKLIVNPVNLGGTVGFNTGMRFAMEKGIYKYVWLLDNDTVIEKKSLTELIKVMENDDTIGIAGSRIVDIENRDLTVEIGGLLRWDTIGVTPYCRNIKDNSEYENKEVDYVAVCSALLRTDAMKKVGLMDERFFLFWDDMDWGLSFKKRNFKVEAVPGSVVYHPPFTEKKRGVLTNFYYGVRNPLLVYTKHTFPLKRLLIFYNHFRRLSKKLIFLYFNNQRDEVSVSIKALKDFYNNRWGQFVGGKGINIGSDKSFINNLENGKAKSFLIIAGEGKEDVLSLRKKVEKNYLGADIALLVTKDREDVFKPYFDKILTVDSNRLNSLFYNARLFLNVLLLRFDICICLSASPFAFAVRKTYLYLAEKDAFTASNNNYFHVYNLILFFIMGELASLIITPIVYLRSFIYKKWTDEKINGSIFAPVVSVLHILAGLYKNDLQ